MINHRNLISSDHILTVDDAIEVLLNTPNVQEPVTTGDVISVKQALIRSAERAMHGFDPNPGPGGASKWGSPSLNPGGATGLRSSRRRRKYRICVEHRSVHADTLHREAGVGHDRHRAARAAADARRP